MRKTRKDLKKHNEIVQLAKQGNTLESIGVKFGITKQRVGQLLQPYGISPIKMRRKELVKNLKELGVTIKNDLNLGISVTDIRKKYNVDSRDIKKLFKQGVDIRLVKIEEVKKRRKKCISLYKKGLTGYEILDIMPEIKDVNSIYQNICRINDGHLPKRVNTRTKKGIKLNKEIIRLRKKNTFKKVHATLIENGFTNLNGNPLRLESVINSYYRWQKKR